MLRLHGRLRVLLHHLFHPFVLRAAELLQRLLGRQLRPKVSLAPTVVVAQVGLAVDSYEAAYVAVGRCGPHPRLILGTLRRRGGMMTLMGKAADAPRVGQSWFGYVMQAHSIAKDAC